MADDIIDRFDGENRFLSNYFNAPIRVNGISYPTNEHAFAAFKSTDKGVRLRIAQASSPGDAKRLGRDIALRADWEAIKTEVMACLVHAKFAQNPQLAQRLLETGEATLVEGNTWNDRVWGVDTRSGLGENRLGCILMSERAVLRTLSATIRSSRKGMAR